MLKVRDLVIGSMLTALALIIPLVFGGTLGVTLPPFSATLASHVPVMLAMLVNPWVAVLVGLGSAFGFLMKLGAVIAARAMMHALFAGFGAVLIKRGWSFPAVLLAVMPVHAISEALVVIPFGFSLYKAGVVIGIGTGLHHLVDSMIAITMAYVTGLNRFSPRVGLKKLTK